MTPVQELDALCTQLDCHLHGGDFVALAECGQRALTLARRLGATAREVEIAVLVAGGHAQQNQPLPALALLEPHESWVREAGTADQCASYFKIKGFSLAALGRLAAARKHHEEALRHAERAGDRAQQAELIGYIAWVASRAGRAEQAAALVGQALAMLSAQDDGPASGHVVQKEAALAGYLRDLGQYERAITMLERLIARFRAEELDAWAGVCELTLAQVWIDLGQASRAVPLLDAPLPGAAFLRCRRLVLRTDLALLLRDGVQSVASALLSDEEVRADTHWRSVAALHALDAEPPERALERLSAVLAEADNAERLGLRMELEAKAGQAARLAGRYDEAHAHASASAQRWIGSVGSRLYRGDVALQNVLTLDWAGDAEAAAVAIQRGLDWLRTTLTHVPVPFRSTFLERHPVNRALIAQARARGMLLAL